jgi:hypothetical protein
MAKFEEELIFELDRNNNYNAKVLCPVCGKENVKYDGCYSSCGHLKRVIKREDKLFAIFEG